MIALAGLVTEHGEAIEYDLLPLGLDLPRDLGSDRLTFRRLLHVILPNLPRESAYKRAVDPVGAQWGAAEYIAARQADLLHEANWQRENEGAKSPSKHPDPYPRPGAAEVRRSGQDARVAALRAQRERARTQRQQDGGEH